MAPGEDELARLRRWQAALVDLGLLCIRESSLQVLLDETARLVRQALEADFTKILELRPNGSLLVRAGDGWPPGVVGEVEIPADSDSQRATPSASVSP